MRKSAKNRDGAKVYEHHLVSGASFSKQIRRKREEIELRAEVDYVQEEEEVLKRFGAAARCCRVFARVLGLIEGVTNSCADLQVADPVHHSIGRTKKFFKKLERMHDPFDDDYNEDYQSRMGLDDRMAAFGDRPQTTSSPHGQQQRPGGGSGTWQLSTQASVSPKIPTLTPVHPVQCSSFAQELIYPASERHKQQQFWNVWLESLVNLWHP